MADIRALQETAVFCALAAEHLRVFAAEIMGFENAPFHNDLDDVFSNYSYQKIVLAFPRGFGKTMHGAVAYPLWEMAKHHGIRILVVSNTAEVARDSVATIRGHAERNQKYRLWARMIDPEKKGVAPRLRSGKRREERWTGGSFTIERDDLNLKDPTVTALGLFGPILSKRADIIVMDDVVTQENAATEEQRAKIKDWVYSTLLPVLVPGGRVICLGNTWHMDDLMANLLKDPQFDVKRRTGAILREANRQDLWERWADMRLDESLAPEEKLSRAAAFYAENRAAMDEGTETLWPERFPYGDLYLKRLANAYSFARMFQCDPSLRPNQKFVEADIERALEKGKDLALQDAARDAYEAQFTVSGLDLAISQKDGADDTALVSLDYVRYGNADGTIKSGDYVLRNIERGKMLPDEVRRMVGRHDAVVRPAGVRVESNGYQEAMSRDLGELNVPIRSYKTGGEKNDPDIGVNSLAILFAQGRIVLPYSAKDARTRRLVTELVNEMRAYPDGHTGDSLMGLWFAYSEARDLTAGRILIPRQESAPPLPYPEDEKAADREIAMRQEVPRGLTWGLAAIEADKRAKEEARRALATRAYEKQLYDRLMGPRR
ncbi:MAG: hypothetical protein KGI78_00380 [Patescibacteria group bacterium]|nr:hypothetical protein [Patescibacteria group bacterium]MDE1944849.1 hypothetical protein [Patescibacteria group bacterium]MDE2057295.1 hypothetical protein [Patescibacteria group bacterium]